VILTHTWDGEIEGLKEFPKEDRPNRTVIFCTFRIMTGFGFLMVALAISGIILQRRGRLYDWKLYQRFALALRHPGRRWPFRRECL
jgi:cytochrome d ubiquinol oxidase subunit I